MTGFVLKIIAILCMLIDHIAAVFNVSVFPSDVYWTMRYIGRIAFPVFCFLIIEGALHTHDMKRYLLRMGIFALISEIPYNLAFDGSIISSGSTNVFFTLFFGLISIAVHQTLHAGGFGTDKAGHTKSVEMRLSQPVQPFIEKLCGLPVQIKNIIAFAFMLLCCILSFLLGTDYSFGGVFTIYIMFICRNKALIRDVSMIVLLYLFFGRVELYGAVSILLFYFYNGKRGPNPKWMQYLFYLFYPVHLLILWGLNAALF